MQRRSFVVRVVLVLLVSVVLGAVAAIAENEAGRPTYVSYNAVAKSDPWVSATHMPDIAGAWVTACPEDKTDGPCGVHVKLQRSTDSRLSTRYSLPWELRVRGVGVPSTYCGVRVWSWKKDGWLWRTAHCDDGKGSVGVHGVALLFHGKDESTLRIVVGKRVDLTVTRARR